MSLIFSYIFHTTITYMQPSSDNQIDDKEYFTIAQCGLDDWKYEMRREIQEIVVMCFLNIHQGSLPC